MNIFKTWFKDNPAKILGEAVEKPDWRDKTKTKTVTVIEGGLENIEAIDVNDSYMPKKGVGMENIKTNEQPSEIKVKNRQKALDAVESKKKVKSSSPAPKTKTKRKRKRKLENIRYFPARPDIELKSFEESFKELNKGLADGYIKAWVFYKKSNNFPLHPSYDKYYDSSEKYLVDAIKEGFICFDPVEGFLPSVLYYSGNIYEKMARIENQEVWKNGIDEITPEQRRKQLNKLKSILPERLRLDAPQELRLNISWKSLFARKYEFVEYGATTTLYESFWSYIFDLSETQLKHFNLGSPYLMYKHIYRKEAKRDRKPEWREQFERESAQELDYQMGIFLNKHIPEKERTKIEITWNREHNGYVEPNYDHIPVAFESNKLFKDAPLMPFDAQREGVSFMDISGNGIIAYDVGVGKTMTSILAVGNALASGQCKRPVIIVPNSTYWKWLAELQGTYDEDGNVISNGILPQYKVNNWYNLGKEVIAEIWNPETGLNEPIAEQSITLLTYDALQHLGFSEELGHEFVQEVADIATQTNEKKGRAREQQFQKAVNMVSAAESGGKVWIDQANWDYMVIDEAHNCNKIFLDVQNADSKDESGKHYKLSLGNEPVQRSVVPFFISRYIQKNNGGRNICLLTATPFNNNPLEVYSILALADMDRLKRLGIGNVRTFFDEYIFTTYEKVVKAGNKIDTKQVVKGWNNKVSLQSVMFAIMNYKSGEDAGSIRPDKYILPKISEAVNGVVKPLPPEEQIRTYLYPTDRQKANFQMLDEWFKEAKEDKDLKAGADLVLITKGMSNTFSPHSFEASSMSGEDDNNVDISWIDPIDFIEESAKLKYTVECIKTIREHHKKTNTEIGGIIIYSNTGVPFFPLLKRYLEEEVGYNAKGYQPAKKWYSEVEIISGGISPTNKENIKNGFLKGKIKVIIGSATIREGIDLQKKTTTIFNLYNEWNPTAYKQLEGRAWRQGNQYKNVRIVTPLLIDSSDAMVWQKLEEKTARINDIFDRTDKTNILDVIEEDREAVKWGIMQDTEAIAKEMIAEEVRELEGRGNIMLSQLQSIVDMGKNETAMQEHKATIKKMVENWMHLDPEQTKASDSIFDIFDRISVEKFSIANQVKQYNEAQAEEFKEDWMSSRSTLKKYYSHKKKYNDAREYVVNSFGEDMLDKLQVIIDKLNDEAADIMEVQVPKLKSDEYLAEVKGKIDDERERLKANAGTMEETIEAFASTNHLLDDLKDDTPAPAPQQSEKELATEAVESMYALKTVLPESEHSEIDEAIELIEKMLPIL